MTGPSVEEEEVGGGIDIDDVNGNADYEEEVDNSIGKLSPA